jgi:hypothetical protein
MSEILTAALLKFLVFRDTTSCRLTVADVSKNRSAFIFRAKQSNLLALLDPEDGSIMILRNVSEYLPIYVL